MIQCLPNRNISDLARGPPKPIYLTGQNSDFSYSCNRNQTETQISVTSITAKTKEFGGFGAVAVTDIWSCSI